MTDSWHSLYLADRSAAQIEAALITALTALGYNAFDPFGLIPARPAPESVRAFIAPSVGGWVRVIAGRLANDEIIRALSADALLLSLKLEGDQAAMALWSAGAPAAWAQILPHAPLGTTPDALDRALNAAPVVTKAQDGDHFPCAVQALAGANLRSTGVDATQVDAKQANRLFDKMMGGLRGKLNADDASAAQALLDGGVKWDSPGGTRVAALASLLLLPPSWRTPDYATVRDAYALHRRLRDAPGAKLYPGDAEAQAAVPNAGDYLPMFYARD